jgi:hypothetical protein
MLRGLLATTHRMPDRHESESESEPPSPEPLPVQGIAWDDVSRALQRQRATPRAPLSADGLERSVRAWTGQIVELTRRAEAAETRARQLEAELATERSSLSALGRRFGQLPLESFPAFVVRLAMVAKAQPLARERQRAGVPATDADTI